MNKVDIFSMRQIGKAIKCLDEFRVHENYVRTKANVRRIDKARKNLINVLFSNGYELQRLTYKVVKSEHKRELI